MTVFQMVACPAVYFIACPLPSGLGGAECATIWGCLAAMANF